MGDIASAATNLRLVAARARHAAPLAANAMAATFVTGVATGELRQTSHRKGTPTPSRPGDPPSLVGGHLRGSFRIRPAVQTGAYTWTSAAYPTIVYARIQEFGGDAGRNHASHLPARPYMRPAAIRLTGALSTTAVATFTAAGG